MSHTINSPAAITTSLPTERAFDPTEFFDDQSLKEYDDEEGIRATIHILSSIAMGLRDGTPKSSPLKDNMLRLWTSVSSILTIRTDETVAVTGILEPEGDGYVIRTSVVASNTPFPLTILRTKHNSTGSAEVIPVPTRTLRSSLKSVDAWEDGRTHDMFEYVCS